MSKNFEQLFGFLSLAEKMKTTLRFGEHPMMPGRKESAAEHSWRLALMSFAVAEELQLDVDVTKAMKLALIHGLVEAEIGNIDAVLIGRTITKEEKERAERQAMEKIKGLLSGVLGDEVFALREEYVACVTLEAKYIKALKRIETVLHIVEVGVYDDYAFLATYADKDVQNFPALLPLLQDIKRKLKEDYEKAGVEWKAEYDVV